MSDAQAIVVIDLAKEFMDMIRHIEPSWERAYFRFCADESKFGSNGSYVCGGKAIIIDPFKWNALFKSMNEKSAKLLSLIGKVRAVILLEIDSTFDYEIKFEYQNLERWKITKINGGTGVPEGI
jgi:hypothetical protein